jgi:conjugative transposon TraM protein
METKTHSGQLLRKRKFFLLLPLLVLPFTTLLFWALGGGKGSDVQAGQSTAKGSLNTQLPDAYLKDDKSLNKLSYYEKAALDSQKLEEQLKNDRYYLGHGKTIPAGLHQNSDTGLLSLKYKPGISTTTSGLNTSPYNNSANSDPNEAKVYEKLNELNRAMKKTTLQSNRTKDNSLSGHRSQASVNSADIDRLEQMMNRSNGGDSDEDPELKQLNGMMDKILAIQHPERVKDNAKQPRDARSGQVFAVTANSNNDNTSLLQNNKGTTFRDTSTNNDFPGNGFFSLLDETSNSNVEANAIQAVIHEVQTVVDGAIVKLRLLTEIFVNGTLVPKESFVFGTASLNGERLNIKINSVRYKTSLFPVQLSVFDMDGMEGIYVPGTITRDVAKASADRAIQGLGMTTLDPSIGAQAASAGIEAAKTLLNRKAKLIKVTLKAGYQVLLRDEKQVASN